MGTKSEWFKSKKEKYVFFGIIAALLVVSSVLFYPTIKGSENKVTGAVVAIQKTPKDYYSMFQCSCCGKPIDTNCCGMAKQRKEYVDNLLLEGLEEKEIIYEMVKKFGFDVLMDQSKEEEVREYVKSRASENPPKIDIENPVYNFGTVSQKNGVVSTMFNIKNTGGSDLVIENIDTSCMCTYASLIYKGEESPRFSMSMHGNNPDNFELRIPPEETAQLKVYYDPNAHGKQKNAETKIIREVTVISNDPVDFQKRVRIEVTQVP